jgi:DNA-binding ferritin-like protein
MANLYVATLRAIYLVLQFCHWETRGLGFYGNHLLFERLYKQSAEDADFAAEKFIGLFGEPAVDYKLQQEFISKLLIKYQDHQDDRLHLALTIEKDFIAFAKQCYDELDKDGTLSLGLDDMIMSQSSNHEGSIYLLKQAIDEETND